MPVWRVFKYLKFYPWNIAANLFFNMLAVLFNMGTFIMIVPFVELLFGTAQPSASLPPFSFDQQYLSLWLTYTLAQYKGIYGLWRCLLAIPPEEFRRAGRCYGGGLQKMEPRELGDLACPALSDWLSGHSGVPYREEDSGQLLFAMEAEAEYDHE